MIAQSNLAYRFACGEAVDDLPPASNIEAEPAEGSDGYAAVCEAALVGYNWAVYAHRTYDGSLVLYDGWRGYSVSTTQQLSQLRSGFYRADADFEVVDKRPQQRGEHRSESNQSRSMHSRSGTASYRGP